MDYLVEKAVVNRLIFLYVLRLLMLLVLVTVEEARLVTSKYYT